MAIVYRHIRLDTNEPFYIGVSVRARRPFENKSRSADWTKVIESTGYDVHILFEDVDEDFAKQKEKEFISLYGRICDGGTLVNKNKGGVLPSIKTRNKISKICSGRPFVKTPLRLQNLYAYQADNKQKISDNRKRSNLSLETLKKMSDSQKGKILSSDTCKKMSESKKGANNYLSKPVIDLSTGVFYNCLSEAAKINKIPLQTLGQYLIGKRTNKTSLRYA